MWSDLAVPVAVAAAATFVNRWSVPGRARRVNQAKAEAELLQLMPEGSAREALQSKLEVDVLQHVSLEKDRKFNAWFRATFVVMLAQAITLGVASYALISVGTNDDPAAWLEWVAVVAILLSVGLQLVYQYLRWRLRGISDKAKENAVDEVARLTAHGHIEASSLATGNATGPAAEGRIDVSGKVS